MWSLSGLIQEYLDGCCASGLWEAKLARGKGLAEKSMSKILSTYSLLIGREKLMKFVLYLIILFLIIRNRMELKMQRGQVFRLVYELIRKFPLGMIQSMIRVQRIQDLVIRQSVG